VALSYLKSFGGKMSEDNKQAENVKKDDGVVDFEEAMSESDDEVVRVPVRSKRNEEKVGYILFKKLGGTTLREWQKLNGGNGNPRKRRPLKANNYLIENAHIGEENLRIPFEEAGYKNSKEFYKHHERGQVFIDIVLGNYLSQEFPDTEDIKD
jgi:hypothetical protein